MTTTLLFTLCMVMSLAACAFFSRRSPGLGFVARPDPTVPNHTKDVPLLGGVGMVGCA
jgi:UDP-N-acetylmuramyl pentapeptide phosphotransferase/UDP-N-acetylglucosamine-1-phosphate transferase